MKSPVFNAGLFVCWYAGPGKGGIKRWIGFIFCTEASARCL